MANEDRERLRHLLVRGTAEPEPYTYPREVRGGSRLKTPPRARADHANRLLEGLDHARDQLADLANRRRAVGLSDERGMCLEFASDPEFELALKSLDRQRDGIELLAVRDRGDTMFATVFVAEGKLEKLEGLLVAYRDENHARWGTPKNRQLVESISEIRQAVLESFWTDDEDLLPESTTRIWWEVWLRVGSDRNEIVERFEDLARKIGLETRPRRIEFPDRTVLLAYGSPEQLSQSVELLDCISELRMAKDRPDFFTGLSPREQAEWSADLWERASFPGPDAPRVCVLDTGINRGHVLLQHCLPSASCFTCDPAWGITDHHGHGTAMGGIALYGDLTPMMGHRFPVQVEHRLESVKLLPPPTHAPNDRDLYGSLTLEAISRAEIAAPSSSRVFCMAVTSPDYRDRGKPSSWSAAIDDASAGVDGDTPRLLVLSAGNVNRPDWRYYPDQNDVDQVHDPGQAWNALTVGAHTEKVDFDFSSFPGWTPVATHGGLSPSSTTSVTWPSAWPNKPDIVMEGGNGIREPGTGFVDTDDSLLLLTTHWRPQHRLLTAGGDTSAAAAQAARLAPVLAARYPEFWPETLRALLVHSAEWTSAMLDATRGHTRSTQARLLLRRYGYGVPSLERACWSASNSLTLVAQDRLQPFHRPRGRSVGTKDMNLHALPWPRDELLALGETPVSMRVTLSYFVEPNPARRGWTRRFRYQSHGLRLAIRSPAEDLDDFRAAVSKHAQDDAHDGSRPDDEGWIIGRNGRRGSIHSDRWEGTAADLAERSDLAVYPVGGWWKERPHLDRWNRFVRYALIVSITTPETDIYTPVATKVGLPVAATVPIP